MLTLWLGLGVLFIGWLLSHLFAAVTTYLLKQIRFERKLASSLKMEANGQLAVRGARTVLHVTRLAAIGLTLALALGIEPFHTTLINLAPKYFKYELSTRLTTIPQEVLAILLGTIVGVQLIAFINRFFVHLHGMIEGWRYTRLRAVKVQGLELFTPNRLTDTLIVVVRYLRWGMILVVASICMTLLFSFYPETHGLVETLVQRLRVEFNKGMQSASVYLPNIITLIIIVFATRYSLKILHFFADGFRLGKVKHSRIHPELAEPTFQLVRFLVIAIALVAAFPYIPGSDSPVFRGISIFIGFLLSLGSTSLVTNIISGIVLTYTRGMRIGDRVQIADAIGDVIERTLLVTRIRTIKNVVITIPNGMVLNNHIINFSSSAEESGLILHTSVTIGYDVPWRQVHQLMIDAALETEYILKFPRPFVLQTSLDDYYVSYELNAYTMKPIRMAEIYSELHQNIQDNFNEAEVEILSPSYAAVRDGQHPSIPQDYLPKQFVTRPVQTFPYPWLNQKP